MIVDTTEHLRAAEAGMLQALERCGPDSRARAAIQEARLALRNAAVYWEAAHHVLIKETLQAIEDRLGPPIQGNTE